MRLGDLTIYTTDFFNNFTTIPFSIINMKRSKSLILASILCTFVIVSNAQQGTLDLSFGTNGIVTTDVNLSEEDSGSCPDPA